MAKRFTFEDQLAAMGALRGREATADVAEALGQGLASKSPHVSAKAAQVTGESEVRDLVPALIAAFDRWMAGDDKGCVAKTAIAEALYRIGPEADPAGTGEDVFLRGIRHVQMEPVFGGKVDVATELRGHCAMGLVRMNHPDAMLLLAELLADPEAGSRAAAARAMGYRGGEDALPVLRYKLAVGDPSAEVVGECVLAMLQLSPTVALPVAERLLLTGGGPRVGSDEVREAIALSLGQSRRPEALGLLKAWWERTLDADPRRVALTAIASLRLDAARDFLLELVVDGDAVAAKDAVRALAIFRYDPAMVQRVRAAVEGRRDATLTKAFTDTFAT